MVAQVVAGIELAVNYIARQIESYDDKRARRREAHEEFANLYCAQRRTIEQLEDPTWTSDDRLQKQVSQGLEARKRHKTIEDSIQGYFPHRLMTQTIADSLGDTYSLYSIPGFARYYSLIEKSDKIGLALLPYGWSTLAELQAADMKPLHRTFDSIAENMLANSQHLLSTLDTECTTLMLNTIEKNVVDKQEADILKALALESTNKLIEKDLKDLTKDLTLFQNKISKLVKADRTPHEELPEYHETLYAVEERFKTVDSKYQDTIKKIREQCACEKNGALEIQEEELLKWSFDKRDSNITKQIVPCLTAENIHLRLMGLRNSLDATSAIVHAKDNFRKQHNDL